MECWVSNRVSRKWEFISKDIWWKTDLRALGLTLKKSSLFNIFPKVSSEMNNSPFLPYFDTYHSKCDFFTSYCCYGITKLFQLGLILYCPKSALRGVKLNFWNFFRRGIWNKTQFQVWVASRFFE